MSSPPSLARLIVADAGPLIAIARLGLLPVLKEIFDEVLVPTVVLAETCRDVSLPGAQSIQAFQEDLHVKEVVETEDMEFPPGLGAGERAAITLAMQEDVGVLMDDRHGRRFAREHSVPVLGTGGFLLLAKQAGHIKRLAPLLSSLQDGGYHLSDGLVRELLSRAEELQ